MECAEVGRHADDNGAHWIIGPVRAWEDVRGELSDEKRERDARLGGRGIEVAIYSGSDEFGERRWYYVDQQDQQQRIRE